MIALVPIFFKDNYELWNSDVGISAIKKFLLLLLDTQEIDRIFVLTDEATILNLAESVGIRSYIINTDDNEKVKENIFFPFGAFVSINYLKEVLKIEVENLMVLNFRNPNIKSELIDNAIAGFNVKQPEVLISMKKSRDHPCQLKSYYKIVSKGFIYLFDDDRVIDTHAESNKNRCYKITKPFSCALDFADFPENIKSINSFFEHNGKSCILKEKLTENLLKEAHVPIFIYESNKLARIILKLDDYKIYEEYKNEIDLDSKNYSVIGVSLSDDFDNVVSLIVRNVSKNKYFIFNSKENLSKKASILKLVPVTATSNGELNNKTIEFNINSLSVQIQLPYYFDYTNITGLNYVFLELVEDDTYDYCEPFPSDGHLWRIEEGSNRKFNLRTNKEIIGREDFPEVFEPNGTFLIMKRDLISSFVENNLKEKIDGFIMDDNNSIQINTELDMMRFKAFQKANENEKGL